MTSPIRNHSLPSTKPIFTGAATTGETNQYRAARKEQGADTIWPHINLGVAT
jgi:hypothetical protein